MPKHSGVLQTKSWQSDHVQGVPVHLDVLQGVLVHLEHPGTAYWQYEVDFPEFVGSQNPESRSVCLQHPRSPELVVSQSGQTDATCPVGVPIHQRNLPDFLWPPEPNRCSARSYRWVVLHANGAGFARCPSACHG